MIVNKVATSMVKINAIGLIIGQLPSIITSHKNEGNMSKVRRINPRYIEYLLRSLRKSSSAIFLFMRLWSILSIVHMVISRYANPNRGNKNPANPIIAETFPLTSVRPIKTKEAEEATVAMTRVDDSRVLTSE